MLGNLTTKFWKKFFAVIAVGGVILGVLTFGAMSLGLIPVAARAPHLGITTFFLHYTFKQSTARAGSSITPPDDLMSPDRVALGLQHYNNVCSSCHGGPELGQSPVALSMRPRPQHLAAVVDQFSDQQLYMILRDGVRFSAMPAWPADSNFDEIWSVVAFLRTLPDMSADEYVAATNHTMPQDAPSLAFEPQQPLRDLNIGQKAPPLDEYFYASPGTGWNDYAMGGQIIATCTACHGADASGSPTGGLAPNLTVQSAEYIAKALREYASATRPSGVMTTVAASLTDAQIDGLARYYDGLPDVPSTQDKAAAGVPVRGQQIALNGKPDALVPACYSCHQNIDAQANMVVPAIAGQSAPYLRNKLEQFAARDWAGTDVWRPMGHIAHALTAQDRADLAAYFASQPIGLSAPSLPQPVGDIANAEALIEQVCAECHTRTGVGTASGAYPNLTLQSPAYLSQQLYAFHAQSRDNRRMTMVAERLSDQDKTDLAAYFGNGPAVKSPTPTDTFATDDEIENGERIAFEGIPNKNVPSCLSCHGATQVDTLPIIARLHGQSGHYIENRLQALGSDASGDLYSLSPMHRIADAMDTQERHDVAAWFAAQQPLAK
ncbi:c-type cytochrome [Loktanella sp. SALINAS62]|uniref:c-type cytochrome n=1 Tax=Loktanella sp. SALINAS62 TaxID=2706124 RepID=UPI001B8C25E9|nr:c-type cytochrome [Loktanella sp. SALINAS62]MBS1301458.1 c-type cytochrome [Loktanella sp. SALINAS62]